MIALLLLAAPVPITPPPGTALKPLCRNPGIVAAARAPGEPGLHPLGDEPPAQHLYAVVRIDVDGCNNPLVISRTVGLPKR